MRAIAAGGEVGYAGRHFRVEGLFSPWSGTRLDRVYLAANRLRMLRLAAEKADGVMVTDLPLAAVGVALDVVDVADRGITADGAADPTITRRDELREPVGCLPGA